jgi:hypothetical protein
MAAQPLRVRLIEEVEAVAIRVAATTELIRPRLGV